MWSRDQTFHFIGIGGIGVSAVARVLHQQGVRVQGSDVRASQLTEALEALGISVTIGHRRENIHGADVVVPRRPSPMTISSEKQPENLEYLKLIVRKCGSVSRRI